EVRRDVLAGGTSFVFHTHQDHRVERVNRSHEQRFRVPIMVRLRERCEIVMSPGVLFVPVPRVEKFSSHLLRLRSRRRLLSRDRGRAQRQTQKQTEDAIEIHRWAKLSAVTPKNHSRRSLLMEIFTQLERTLVWQERPSPWHWILSKAPWC